MYSFEAMAVRERLRIPGLLHSWKDLSLKSGDLPACFLVETFAHSKVTKVVQIIVSSEEQSNTEAERNTKLLKFRYDRV